MNEKKTVLFLMNGLGVQTAKSFEVYSKEIMPTFDTLMNNYPFKLLYSNGEFIGANKGEVSNFKSGYYNFASFGHPKKKEDVLNSKIASNEFASNPVVNNSIEIAVRNSSNLHIMFTLGDKVSNDRYEHLKAYLDLANQRGVKQIYVHLILGDSSTRGQKIADTCLSDFKNRVLRYYPDVKIASVCGRMYVKNGSINDIADFYRMMVSAVGEVWNDYEATIHKKYEHGMNDDNMTGFITIYDRLLCEGDSFFMFNYSNNIAKQLFEIILNPKKYFPTSSAPENISINAMFTINNMPQIPRAFPDAIPDTCLLEKIPSDKKVLIIASKDRIPHISKTLNGFKPTFSPNVSVWPIEDQKNRFESLSQYLAAYINQDVYDLIIADCQLYNPKVDERTIDQLKKNMSDLDKCLNITYNQVLAKNYRLIATSLYGLRQAFKLTVTMETVDFSQKVPFLLIDKEIRRVDIVFKPEPTIIDVARIIAISFGCPMPNDLIVIETPKDKKKKNRKKLLLIIVPILLLLIIVVVWAYMYGLI